MLRKVKYIAPTILGLAFSQASLAQQEANPYRLTFKTANECTLLTNQECKGSRKEVRFETPSGYSLSIEKINDDGSGTPFDQTYELKNVGNIHGNIHWDKKVTGTIGRIGMKFAPTENSSMNMELYAGELTGAIRLKAGIDATIYPLSVSVAGKTYSYPGVHQDLAIYDYQTSGTSYYGGVRESAGAGFKLSRNTHLTINQFGQVGLDRVSYGAGLGVAYTSDPDDKIGAQASTICQRGDFYSTARYAFIVSVCGNKVKKDLIYDKMHQKADRLAGNLNARTEPIQNIADKIEEKTGYGHQFPHHTGDSVMNFLGFKSPYGHIDTSMVFAASANVGGATITLSRTQPFNTARDGRGTTSLYLGYHF